MKPERSIHVEHEWCRHRTEGSSHPLHGNRPDLLGLDLGVMFEPALTCRNQDLERVDPIHIGGHRRHGDYTSPETGSCGVGPIIADENSWSLVSGLAWQRLTEIDHRKPRVVTRSG